MVLLNFQQMDQIEVVITEIHEHEHQHLEQGFSGREWKRGQEGKPCNPLQRPSLCQISPDYTHLVLAQKPEEHVRSLHSLCQTDTVGNEASGPMCANNRK